MCRNLDEMKNDAANRATIVANLERQTEHRMTLENKVVSGNILRSNIGLVGGFVLALPSMMVWRHRFGRPPLQ